MWPLWDLETIALRSDTLIHVCAIIGAVIFAFNLVFIVMLGVRYVNERKRNFEQTSSSNYAFWFPLTLTLAMLIGGPVGAVIGWYVGMYVGVALAHFGLALLAIGVFANITSSSDLRRRPVSTVDPNEWRQWW